jgi:hypothetical protein
MYEFDPIFFIFIDSSSTTLIVYRNYRQAAMLTCRESCDSQVTLAKTSNREKKKKFEKNMYDLFAFQFSFNS